MRFCLPLLLVYFSFLVNCWAFEWFFLKTGPSWPKIDLSDWLYWVLTCCWLLENFVLFWWISCLSGIINFVLIYQSPFFKSISLSLTFSQLWDPSRIFSRYICWLIGSPRWFWNLSNIFEILYFCFIFEMFLPIW